MLLVGKDPRIFFSLHGIMRRCLWAERSGVPARLPRGWPKVPPERTVNSVSGAGRDPGSVARAPRQERKRERTLVRSRNDARASSSAAGANCTGGGGLSAAAHNGRETLARRPSLGVLRRPRSAKAAQNTRAACGTASRVVYSRRARDCLQILSSCVIYFLFNR